MATLVLQAAGQAVGTAIGGPAGGVIGRAVGAVSGQLVDQALLGPAGSARTREGPRLSDLQVQSSSEGAPIPKIYGRVRLAGQIVWATNFEEQVTTSSESAGGKGGVTGGQTSRSTSYSYFANFAVALCEGPITRLGRVWADGKELDLSSFTYRFYRGGEAQGPDSLIETKEGAGMAPAFKGVAYVVFERLPLARFGNRIPQLSFELFNALDDVESRIRAVTIIPGATEFGYDTVAVVRKTGQGQTAPENTNSSLGDTDWTAALDQLQATCPNLTSVALVVAWFGTDLRAGNCEFRPGVDNDQKVTSPESWVAGGVDRGDAHLVSTVDGRAAFGGTPSDASVIRAIQDLKSRGLEVMFYPFVMMDIPATNSLPDPYGGGTGQAAYPWRGLITCDPAPGQPGTPDKTAAAGAQVDAVFGMAVPGDFTVDGAEVSYSGPAEWSLRRMLCHYAHLCVAAGGVDSFLIGSEMRGLTHIRGSADHFLAVDHYVAVAADIAAILGPEADISYAADWSEYFGYQPTDGSGDVYFHLDPLWADPNIAFVGIDTYMPLADWRDGRSHLDWQAGVRSQYELGYLKGNIAGGEGFDWYYASDADRDAQARTAISDGAYGKPWVFRYKDLKSWWGNAHHDRPGGVESATPTAWTPQAKPIRFTEAGCPAIDKGANEPNVFVDAKSSQSRVPHYSNGARDDFAQRRFIEALTTYWDPAADGGDPAVNPESTVYGGPMVDAERLHIWTWDARPFPAFPFLGDVWSDGANWELGHWINGRLGAAPLDKLVAAIIERFGFADFDAGGLAGLVDGFVIDRAMSVRDALEPLSLAFFFDGIETGGGIRFLHRGGGEGIAADTDDLAVAEEPGGDIVITRAQETELPLSVRIGFIDGDSNYRKASVESRRLVGGSQRQGLAELPIVTTQARAIAIADTWLQDSWSARERVDLALPMSALALDPGDFIDLDVDGRRRLLRIGGIEDGADRRIQARSIELGHFSNVSAPARMAEPSRGEVLGPALLDCLDLPLLTGNETAHAGHFAGFADPWPGLLAILRSPGTSAFELNQTLDAPAVMGETLWDFYAGPVGRRDRGNRIQVRLYGGQLASVEDDQLFAGANLAAIRNPDDEWEVVQFRTAELVGAGTYEISMFLRGQGGTESAMRDPVPVGARFVVLNGAVKQAQMSPNDVGLPFNYRHGPAARDIADPAYATLQHAFSGVGLRPLSPVHVRGLRIGNDVHMSWIRRTRLGGDSWVAAEVPLGEEFEAYEVDILDGGEVVRTLAAGTPSAVYSEAMQIDDWSGLPGTIDVRVTQLSAAYGRGAAREHTLYV